MWRVCGRRVTSAKGKHMQILDRVNLYSHRHSRVQMKNLQSITRSYKVSRFLQRRAKTLAERCTASRQIQTRRSRNLKACSERWRAALSANHSSSRSSGRILGQLTWRVTACCLMWRDLQNTLLSLRVVVATVSHSFAKPARFGALTSQKTSIAPSSSSFIYF